LYHTLQTYIINIDLYACRMKNLFFCKDKQGHPLPDFLIVQYGILMFRVFFGGGRIDKNPTAWEEGIGWAKRFQG
jgi:hypothetical protein